MEKKNLLIFGAGGLGREMLLSLTFRTEYNILGFVDDTPELQGKTINGFPVLGDSSWLLNYNDTIQLVIGIGSSKGRKKVYERFAHKNNISYPNIISGDVFLSDTVIIGKGCIINAHSGLTVNISLGDFVLVNGYCNIGHDASLGDFVTLYGNVSVPGNVSIGACAEIGVGVRILPKKTIGENSIVGIGSVVVRNVPPNCTVFGNPAKRLF